MPYVLTDNEYADFAEMRRMFNAGRDNAGGGGSGPVLPGGRVLRYPPRMVIVEITGDEAGAEVYECDVYEPATAFYSLSTAPSAANLRGTKICDGAVFINLQGIGQTGHSLTDASNTNQKFFVGMMLGATVSDRSVIIGNAAWFDSCPSSRPGEILAPEVVTADTTLDDTMQYVFVDTTVGDITLTLPSIASIGAYSYTIQNGSGNNVIIDGDGSETVQTVATLVLSDGDSVTITSPGTGTNWF